MPRAAAREDHLAAIDTALTQALAIAWTTPAAAICRALYPKL
jgi:hypothetical protein